MTNTKTETLLKVLNVLTWIAFIGLMVKAGSFLFSYVFSLNKPQASHNFYSNVDLYIIREFSFVHYTVSVILLFVIAVITAYTAYLVIKVLSTIRLSNPFTTEVSMLLERISYLIVSIWLVTVISNAHTKWLAEKISRLRADTIPEEFIFLAGVVFVMAQVFKKGVELQSENELTV